MRIKTGTIEAFKKVIAIISLVVLVAPSLPPAVFAQSTSPDSVSESNAATETTPSDIPTPSTGDSAGSFEPNSQSAEPTQATQSPQPSSSQSQSDAKPETSNPQTQTLSSTPEPTPAQNEVINSQKPQRAEVLNNTGGLSYSFPIVVPPGRNNLQPELKLSYASDNAQENGIFGKGWSISIPYIERINRYGVDELYSSSSSQFYSSSLDGELATTIVASVYTARVENGSFNTYTFTNNQWTVRDKNGLQFTFGSTASTRQDDPTDSSRTCRWMLEEVRDPNDNYIKYSYYKDAGQIYPDSIKYTGNGITDGIFEVDFLREGRSDTATSSRAGFPVSTNYRVYEIDTMISGSLARKYAISYSTGSNGMSSLLHSITESGIDESGNISTLPSTTFGYNSNTPGWTNDATWNLPVLLQSWGQDYDYKFIDVNGDGLVDIMRSDYSGSHESYINNGHGWTNDPAWDLPVTLTDYYGKDVGYQFVDINGDHLIDIVRSDSANSSHDTYLNNGHGWTSDPSWDLPVWWTTSNVDNGYRFLDVNGDGLPDIVLANYVPGANQWYATYINTGHGWVLDTNWNMPVYITTNQKDDGWLLSDVNGDGLPDMLYSLYNDYSHTATYYSYINNGHGWILDPSWNLPIYIQNGSSRPGYQYVDVNGDGLVDIMNSTNPDSYESYINNGHGWTGNSAWNLPVFLWNYGPVGYKFVDVNGDGLPDIMNNRDIYGYASYINNGKAIDLLVSVSHAAGGSTSIQYKHTAAYFDGSNNLTNTSVPFSINTVSKISTNDGTATSTEDTYSYKGGKFQYYGPYEKKLAGFAEVDKTDGAGNVTKTYFHTGSGEDSGRGEYQDNYWKIGKQYRIEKYDDKANLYEKIIYKWDSVTSVSSISGFAKMSEMVSFSYDGHLIHKEKAESYSYDDITGNLTKRIEYGQVLANDDGTFTDTGSDKITTEICYASGASSNILSAISIHTVTDQSNAKVKESRSYYDNLALGVVGNGNQTKKEDWVSGTSYVNSQNSYNAYGLVISSTDPRGKTTSYSYDSHNLYPATVTQPLNLAVNYLYDYGSGQVVTSTDPNGNKSANVYDGLSRIRMVKQPDPSATSTLLIKTDYAYNDATSSISVLRTDYLSGSMAVQTYTYYDGLKRLKQTRKSAENGYYETKDIGYNNVGMVKQESLPYVSMGASGTEATSTAALYANYTYDALQRVTAITDAVGTTTKEYVNWKIIITDPNGNKKDLKYDAYGNLTEVNEHHFAGVVSGLGMMSVLNQIGYADASLWPLGSLFDEIASPEPSASDMPGTSASTEQEGEILENADPSSRDEILPAPSSDTPSTLTSEQGSDQNVANSNTNQENSLTAPVTVSSSPSAMVPMQSTELAPPVPVDTDRQSEAVREKSYGWNHRSEVLAGGVRRIEYHAKQIAFMDDAGDFKPIDVTPKASAGGWEVTQNTFIARFPTRSVGTAVMVNNNRFDTRSRKTINQPAQSMTITALDVADVAGELEYGDVGYGLEWYVRYPRAYPDRNADLIYLVWHGKVPRLQKLIRFNSALPEDADFQFIFSYPDNDPEFTDFRGLRWNKSARFTSSQPVRVEGDSYQRGFGMKEFKIWDTAIGMERKVSAVNVDIQKDDRGYVLTKHIPSSFFRNAGLPAFADTTITVYPDPDQETSSVDGYFNCDTSYGCGTAGNWNSVVNAAYSGSVDDSGGSMETNARDISGGRKIVRRAAILFDTSGMGANTVVNAASLYVMPADIGTPSESVARHNIYSSNPASNTSLSTGDYSGFGSVAFSTSVPPSSMSINSYVIYDLNSSGRGAIAPTGITKLGIREATYDVSNTSPVANDARVTWYSAEQSGSSKDPKLIIDYGSTALAPISPTDLLTEDQTSPTNVMSTSPHFSAIYHDPNVGDFACKYRVQVSASDGNWDNLAWDSGITEMATTSQGSRSPDISYAGSTLIYDGSTYYWRIKFWDIANTEGIYSTSTASFTMHIAPSAPTDLLAEGKTDPVAVTSVRPEFSAVFRHPGLNSYANAYQIQVSTSGTSWDALMWDSGKAGMATTTRDSRSPDIIYSGTPLSLDGGTYWWRIRFWDTNDSEGYFSTPAAYFTLSDNRYVTRYEYSGLNLLTKITDAQGNVRNFTYDGLGRRLTAQDLHDPEDEIFGTWTYTYDDSGNIIQVIDPKNQTIDRTYDDINRILTEDYTGQAGTEVSYTYDSCIQGRTRLCSVSSSAVTLSNTYNAIGQLTQENKVISGTSTVFTTSYAYDRQGNLLTLTNPDNSQIKYSYNQGGRIETVQRKESSDVSFLDVVTDFNYGPHGKVTYQQNANCTHTVYTYDPAQLYRLTNKLTAYDCESGEMQEMMMSLQSRENESNRTTVEQEFSPVTPVSEHAPLNPLLTMPDEEVDPAPSVLPSISEVSSVEPFSSTSTATTADSLEYSVQQVSAQPEPVDWYEGESRSGSFYAMDSGTFTGDITADNFDSTEPGSPVTSLTKSFTVGDNEYRGLYVLIRSSNVALSSVTWNGTAMSSVTGSIINNTTYGHRLEWFHLENADAGTHDLVVTPQSSCYLSVYIHSYYGVKPDSQVDAAAVTEITSATQDTYASITTNTDDAWVLAGVYTNYTDYAITSYQMTQRAKSPVWYAYSYDSDGPQSPGTYTAHFSTPYTRRWFISVISIKPAGMVQPPTVPTELLTENQTNPNDVTDKTPEFSAIYNDPDIGDSANYYQVQVSTSGTSWSSPMWDTGKTAMSTTTRGSRSPDISYAGTPLSYDGSTYYWRIKFWDVENMEGEYSTSTASFTMHANVAPIAPTGLLVDNYENPVSITSTNPKFSAIFNDSDPNDLSR